jgi:hypothetical protein
VAPFPLIVFFFPPLHTVPWSPLIFLPVAFLLLICGYFLLIGRYRAHVIMCGSWVCAVSYLYRGAVRCYCVDDAVILPAVAGPSPRIPCSCCVACLLLHLTFFHCVIPPGYSLLPDGLLCSVCADHAFITVDIDLPIHLPASIELTSLTYHFTIDEPFTIQSPIIRALFRLSCFVVRSLTIPFNRICRTTFVYNFVSTCVVPQLGSLLFVLDYGLLERGLLVCTLAPIFV